MKIIKKGTYRCHVCGCEEFIGHQLIRADVCVGSSGEFERNLKGGLEAHIYDAEKPYGPFTCMKCGAEFSELPENEMVELSRGLFFIARGVAVARLKSNGYGFHHSDEQMIVISNGVNAVAITEDDYRQYYAFYGKSNKGEKTNE